MPILRQCLTNRDKGSIHCMTSNISVLFVCVNYNSYEQLDSFLLSIKSAYNQYTQSAGAVPDIKVVVADNSTVCRPVQTDSYPFPVLVHQTNLNAGYLGGVTHARAALGLDFSQWTFSVISNVDVQIAQDFFINLAAQSGRKGVGCIAPAILSQKTNADRNPKMLYRAPVRNLKIMKFLFSVPVLYRLKTKIRPPKIKKTGKEELDIYAAHGSFIIFTAAFAPFLNSFEFPSFLFCEEIYFAEHLAQAGLITRYVPSIVITDIDHQSTGKMKLRSYCRMNRKSIKIILKEYYR